jgi:hypothetical protein
VSLCWVEDVRGGVGFSAGFVGLATTFSFAPKRNSHGGSLDPSFIVWSGNEDGQRRSMVPRIDDM